MTPEGEVKRDLNKMLSAYGEDLYRWMPVPSGYGESALDYVCCYKGIPFMIETKRLGKPMTERQLDCTRRFKMAGGHVFRVHSAAHIEELREWLRSL